MAKRWVDEFGCLLKGKYSGESVEEIAQTDPNYLEWLLSEVDDLDGSDVMVIEEALVGYELS